MHNFTTFCYSNESILWSLRWDAMTLINRWQNAADNGYGLFSGWGNATQEAIEGFDAFCEWLPQSYITKAIAHTLMNIALFAMASYWLGGAVREWWQAQGIDYALTIAEGLSIAGHGAVCVATLAAFLAVGLVCGGVSCLVVAGICVRQRVWPVVVGVLDKGLSFVFCLEG